MKTQRRKTRKKNIVGDSNDIWRQNPDTIRRFLDQRPDYEQLCTEIAYILNKRITTKGIEISTVTWRAKTLKSFLDKIERKKYGDPFKEITDFAGVRVVSLYISDISTIEEIIRDDFEVVEKVDKLKDKGADRFGYGAIHFIAKLGRGSSGARYDDLKTLLCEIQVRTVLQDAWAIIDHHLVYKNESDVPTHLHRKLNSLAGLFETADDQFDRVRTERASYLAEVRGSQTEPQLFLRNELNKDSFGEYLKWKFPGLPQESYKGQIDVILGRIDKDKYQKLADLDDAVEKSMNILNKVNDEIREVQPLEYAASQVVLALAFADKDYRQYLVNAPGTSKELGEIIQKNAIN